MIAACAPEPQVLIVEDDVDIREALSQILEEEGYVVSTAANGQEALARLRTGPPPRVILLDLMMPVMDGWQFRAAQRQDPQLAQIPVVIISADSNVRDKASSIGAHGFFRKPIEIAGLLATVERCCLTEPEGKST